MMYGACAWVQRTVGYTGVCWVQWSVPGWGDHRAHWGTGPSPLTEGSQRCAGVYGVQGCSGLGPCSVGGLSCCPADHAASGPEGGEAHTTVAPPS